MKKKMNVIFYGSSFIASVLIEAYSITIFGGNLFSTIGIGIVVLVTGYLLMDSIRDKIAQNSENAKFYMDHLIKEETEKWSERYTELLNIQKATYTATKKNTAILTEQFDEVLLRLETLENNNTKALQKITDLQKKALEGQKNALNFEINYNKENTKRLMGVFREEGKSTEFQEQLSTILTLLEDNNRLLKTHGNNKENTDSEVELDTYQETGYQEVINENDTLTKDFYEELDLVDHINDDEVKEENASESNWTFEEEQEPEAINPISENEENDKPAVIPLYDDPNKALTADEIAALFASFGQ
jgi:hypothetical protein